jgi:hypothetical protein
LDAYWCQEEVETLCSKAHSTLSPVQPENIYQFGADYFANKLNPEGAPAPAEQEERVDLHLLDVAASVDVSQMETTEVESLVLSECI